MNTIYLVLGSIGTGKSTLAKELFMGLNLDFISSDLYKKMFFHENAQLSTGYKKADLLADYKLEANCKNKVDFVYELCPTNGMKIERIIDLKVKYKYKFISFIVGTNNVDINITRTQNRYDIGKADYVPAEKVVSRYSLAFENMPTLVKQSEKCYFIDNSEYYKPIAYLSNEMLHLFNFTEWFNNFLLNKIENI